MIPGQARSFPFWVAIRWQSASKLRAACPAEAES